MRATLLLSVLFLLTSSVPALAAPDPQFPGAPAIPTPPSAPKMVAPPSVPYAPLNVPQAPSAPRPYNPPVGYNAPFAPNYPDNPTLESSLEKARELRARHKYYRDYYTHRQRQTSEEKNVATVKSAQEALLEAASKSVQATVQRLLEEYGPNSRYLLTDNFIVIYDTTDRYAAWCGELFEQVKIIYEAFALNIRLPRYDETDPMIVVLFTDKEDYEKHLGTILGAKFTDNPNKPIGIYLEESNRSIVYDISGIEKTKANEKKHYTIEQTTEEIKKRPDARLNVTTMIHEATHQVAFNRGLFMRGKKNPTWAVEGLSSLFEGLVEVADDAEWTVEKDFPCNARRKAEYEAVRANMNGETLKKIVVSEQILGADPTEYPGAWALFYYLYQQEPRRLAQYLFNSILSQPRESYTEEERVYDFEVCFGTNWDELFQKVDAFVMSTSTSAAPEATPAAETSEQDAEIPATEEPAQDAKAKATETPAQDAKKSDSKETKKEKPTK